jgi:hypothetical protein
VVAAHHRRHVAGAGAHVGGLDVVVELVVGAALPSDDALAVVEKELELETEPLSDGLAVVDNELELELETLTEGLDGALDVPDAVAEEDAVGESVGEVDADKQPEGVGDPLSGDVAVALEDGDTVPSIETVAFIDGKLETDIELEPEGLADALLLADAELVSPLANALQSSTRKATSSPPRDVLPRAAGWRALRGRAVGASEQPFKMCARRAKSAAIKAANLENAPAPRCAARARVIPCLSSAHHADAARSTIHAPATALSTSWSDAENAARGAAPRGARAAAPRTAAAPAAGGGH